LAAYASDDEFRFNTNRKLLCTTIARAPNGILGGQGRALLEECIAKQTYVAFLPKIGRRLDWPGIKRAIVTTLHAKQDG